jgi:hypothetical protein
VKSKWMSVSAVLCFSTMMTSVQAGNAQLQPLEPAEPQWMTEMLEQGWQKVAEGVLQRSEGEGNSVESFFYNQEGLLWRVEYLQGRVRFFEGLYNNSPSQDLATVITSLKDEVAEIQDRLRSGEAEAFTGEEMANCTINYGATADAHWLTGSQAPGVTGTASAHFSSNCGHYGKTYASVYVHAVAGTVDSTKTQTDDRPLATSSSAFATFSVTGSTDCVSYAVARTESSALNILYTTEDWNYSCPAPPPVPTVTVYGQPDYYTYYYGPQCTTVSWSASGSGGTQPYTIQWYIGSYHYATGTSFSLDYCNTDATVTVTAKLIDGTGQIAQQSYTSWVYHEEDPYSCGGYNCNCGPQYPTRFEYAQPYDQICPAY